MNYSNQDDCNPCRTAVILTLLQTTFFANYSCVSKRPSKAEPAGRECWFDQLQSALISIKAVWPYLLTRWCLCLTIFPFGLKRVCLYLLEYSNALPSSRYQSTKKPKMYPNPLQNKTSTPGNTAIRYNNLFPTGTGTPLCADKIINTPTGLEIDFRIAVGPGRRVNPVTVMATMGYPTWYQPLRINVFASVWHFFRFIFWKK